MNNEFEIQKEIFETQWRNIRYYWDKSNQAVLQTTALPFLVLFGNLLDSEANVNANTRWILKIMLFIAVLVIGYIVYKTLDNYYERSLRARKVVVEIETSWELHRSGGLFSHQDSNDKYRYDAFAHAAHTRMSQQKLQIIYATVVTVLSASAVLLLF